MSAYPTVTRSTRTVQLVAAGAALLAVLLPAGLVWAQAQPPAPRQRFDAADKNRDGKLDREEFYTLAVDSFYFRDKDKRGYLTVEQLREASPEAFKAANRKGDGRLTLDEYVNALFLDFERADGNHDGALSFEEIQAYRQASPR